MYKSVLQSNVARVSDSTKTMYDTGWYIALRCGKTGGIDVIGSLIREKPYKVTDGTKIPGRISLAVSDGIRILEQPDSMVRQAVRPVIKTMRAGSSLLPEHFSEDRNMVHKFNQKGGPTCNTR